MNIKTSYATLPKIKMFEYMVYTVVAEPRANAPPPKFSNFTNMAKTIFQKFYKLHACPQFKIASAAPFSISKEKDEFFSSFKGHYLSKQRIQSCQQGEVPFALGKLEYISAADL